MGKTESGPAEPGEAPRQQSSGPQNAKERLYEKMRIPLPVLDLIIIILVILLAAAFIAGLVLGRT